MAPRSLAPWTSMPSGKGVGKRDLEKGVKDTDKNTKRRRRDEEDRKETWGPFGCWPCPLKACSALTFLFFPPPYNLPGVLLPPPSSCHGYGNLDLEESSLCLATRLQHCLLPACLPARGWPARLLPGFGASTMLRGDPALPPQDLGWRPWHDWHQEASENRANSDMGHWARELMGDKGKCNEPLTPLGTLSWAWL